MMKNIFYKIIPAVFLTAILIVGCKSDEDSRVFYPTVQFTQSASEIQPNEGVYEIKLALSQPAGEDIRVKLDYGGSALKGEQYTVETEEIVIRKGDTQGVLRLTVRGENLKENLATIDLLLVPGKNYGIDPNNNTRFELVINNTNGVIASFAQPSSEIIVNPMAEEAITFTVNLTDKLANPATATVKDIEGLIIGEDILVNGGKTGIVTVPANVTSFTFEVTVLKKNKDIVGYLRDMKVTLIPDNGNDFVLNSLNKSVDVHLSVPEVDLGRFLYKAALNSDGFQIGQQYKNKSAAWSTALNVNLGTQILNEKSVYIKPYRGQTWHSTNLCWINATNGDLFRFNDMYLKDAPLVTGTTIADYGNSGAQRYFLPSDTLLYLIADPSNPNVGRVRGISQKFIGKLALTTDWEANVVVDTKTRKYWHIDSNDTEGDITKSTFSKIKEVVEIELVKLEGTYDFSSDVIEEREMVFAVWFRSSSASFAKMLTSANYNVVKDGDLYKFEYRFYSRK